MKQAIKRSLSILIALALVLSFAVGIVPMQAKAASTITEAAGHLETAYVIWSDVSGASGYNVYVQASGSSSWTQLDGMLVREYPNYWRADALGLKAGNYVLKVVPVIGGSESSSAAMTTGTLTVKAHDRSGYGFVSGASLKSGKTVTTSSGAYNDDGTLKSNAVVVYVTNDNKNSVSATIGGSTYTGISNILAASVIKNMSTPLCIRLIGNITDPGSGTAFDKGDLLIDNQGNPVGLTIEGVGHDATCNGFGIRLKNSSNVELRNLAVMNCDSSEGDNIGIQQTCDHIWVHNCDLFYGHAGSDADQAKGDGALDTKKSEYITHSYNHFWDCGKCNLQGGSTSDTSDNITYHHNWYDHSDSRHPRVRVATVHVYNNYYDGVSKYGIGAAYKSEVISECNYFRNTKNPMLISTMGSDEGVNTMSGETPGTLTSYNDYVTGATSWIPNYPNIQGATGYSETSYDCTIINSTYNAYSYNLQTAEEAKATVEAYAGRINHGDFIWRFNNSVDDTSYDVNADLKSALNSYVGSVVSAGGVKITSGTGGDGSVSGGQTAGACDHTNVTTTTVAATCTTAGKTTVTCDDCGTQISSSATAALGHNYSGGTCTRCGLVDASSCSHSNETSAVTAPTCTEDGYTTYTCTACGTTRIANTVAATDHTPGAAATCETAQTCTVCGDTVTAALGHNYVDSVCTRCGAEDLAASGYIHNFTESGKTSTFYTISGNTSTTKGTVSYNGLTLSTCLKIESSTNISFTAPKNGTLTLVFGGSTSASGKAIKIDGVSNDIDSTQILTVDVAAGSHTITKDDSIFLFYMAYAPEGSSSGGDVHTHSYAESITTAATCTTDGVKTFACSCGDSYTEAIPATGHSYTAKVTAPTCTAQGYTTYTCACGDSYVDDFVAATGHSYTAKVTAPTCTAQGYTTYTCSCGDSYVADYVAETGHDYSSDLQAPTCTESGLRTFTCGTCGHSYTETVAALGHSYSDGSCTVCGAADPDAETPDETIKNGLVKGDDGNYYYYIDNVLQSDYTGLVANSAGRWYILNGQAQLSYDGLITFEGTKYLIKAGHVNTAFTGITKQEGVYYYFAAGVNDLEFEGLVYCNGMKAYVQDGEVNFNKTGVVEDEGNLVYVKYGIWRNTFKGLARTDDGQWIYMVNGTFDATYTGVAKLNANWVYVENGYVSSTYSGTVTVNGVDYTVKYGVVQF